MIMARKPDVPCAGCGRLLWGGSTSLPAGRRLCRSCRADPIRQAQLAEKMLERNRVARKARYVPVPQHQCAECGAPCGSYATYCRGCAKSRRLAHFQRKNLVRRAGGDEPMSVAELGERDRWRCHLCRRAVNQDLRHPHRMSASRDHLIPVADGGTNDPANLALAHWICNVRRGTRGAVQLALVG